MIIVNQYACSMLHTSMHSRRTLSSLWGCLTATHFGHLHMFFNVITSIMLESYYAVAKHHKLDVNKATYYQPTMITMDVQWEKKPYRITVAMLENSPAHEMMSSPSPRMIASEGQKKWLQHALRLLWALKYVILLLRYKLEKRKGKKKIK